MTGHRFVDASGTTTRAPHFWEPIVITAAEIDAEIERLAALRQPAGGRRASRIAHPTAPDHAPGLAPGIAVTLNVLLPGERTAARRHNSTHIEFCIRGAGHAVIDGQRVDFAQYDVWNVPSFRTYWHENDTEDLQVRLTYSNAPLLELLEVHLVDDSPPEVSPAPAAAPSEEEMPLAPPAAGTVTAPPAPAHTVGTLGAGLLPYERLIAPPSVVSPALHWPWREVKQHLDELDALGPDYKGRRLYLLYNPVTGRTNGTTPNFFATMTIRPPGITDRPHRHVSAAINYYFQGSGHSVVAGKRYHWAAGDLMLSAPGWAIHHHASDHDGPVYELTVQDQPLHIAMESLLWQEDLREPARVLGTSPGFETNRSTLQP